MAKQKPKPKITRKVLTAQCIHCGKTIASLYNNQLKWNHEMHEKGCPKNPMRQQNEK